MSLLEAVKGSPAMANKNEFRAVMWELVNGERVIFKGITYRIDRLYVSTFGTLWVELKDADDSTERLPLASTWELMPNIVHAMRHHTANYEWLPTD